MTLRINGKLMTDCQKLKHFAKKHEERKRKAREKRALIKKKGGKVLREYRLQQKKANILYAERIKKDLIRFKEYKIKQSDRAKRNYKKIKEDPVKYSELKKRAKINARKYLKLLRSNPKKYRKSLDRSNVRRCKKLEQLKEENGEALKSYYEKERTKRKRLSIERKKNPVLYQEYLRKRRRYTLNFKIKNKDKIKKWTRERKEKLYKEGGQKLERFKANKHKAAYKRNIKISITESFGIKRKDITLDLMKAFIVLRAMKIYINRLKKEENKKKALDYIRLKIDRLERGVKWCNLCKQEKPLTDFYFYNGNTKGASVYCRQHEREIGRKKKTDMNKSYIKGLILGYGERTLDYEDITDELVNLKRAHLKLRRCLRDANSVSGYSVKT